MSTRKAKTAKVVPRVTPTQSNWRIWDPGRNEAHVVLRGVIVENGKHDTHRYGVVCVADYVSV
jgi:hypothetical protein